MSEVADIELRVLQGPQAGSRLSLVPGQRYTLGQDETCAVVLAGAQVEPEHAQIRADADGVVVVPRQGRVRHHDGSLVDSTQPLALGTVLQLGRVTLCVAPCDAPWPADDALEPDAVPTPASAGPSGLPAADGQARMPATSPAPISAPGRGSARALTALALLALSAMTTVAIAGRALLDPVTRTAMPELAPVTAPPSHTSPPASAQQAAPRPSTAERLFLVRQFLAQSQRPQVLHLSLQAPTDDTLRVTVIAASREQADRFEQSARQSLAAAAPIAFETLLPDQVRERFLSALERDGLAARFTVLSRAPALRLQAQLPLRDLPTWERLFMDFTATHGTVLGIHAVVHTERDTLPERIQSIVAGPYPFVVTRSGERVAPGGQIDGLTLVSIGPGELVFADGLRVRLSP